MRRRAVEGLLGHETQIFLGGMMLFGIGTLGQYIVVIVSEVFRRGGPSAGPCPTEP